MKVFFTNFFLFIASYTQLNQENKSHQSHLLTHRIMDDTFNEDSLTEYEKVLRKMFCRRGKKKDGLSNMIKIYDSIGKPLDDPNISVVHVAGTNGKGSVCIKIAKALQLAGHKVGLFTSPHVSSYRERMSINGELISEEQVVKYLNEVTAFSEANKIPSTFFELTEGVAFRYFSEGGVDVVVLETGLGGLTDPTNVISNPALSIVTSIGLEHTEYLGDTIELIGRQKAGIIKRNCPVLVGPNVPHETIRQCAAEREAEGYYTCEDVLGPDVLKNNEKKKKVFDYDLENSRTAQAALTLLRNKKKEGVIDSNFPSSLLSDDIIAQGIQHRPTCRFEIIKNGDNVIILDVAHNPQGMMNLVEKLEATYPGKNKRFVVGMSAEKDVWSICNILLDVVPNPSNIHLVEAVNDRAATIQTILDAQPKLLKSNFAVKDRSVTAQIKLAMELAAKNNEIVVVCGSVFLMSEARQALGIEEARDSEKIFL